MGKRVAAMVLVVLMWVDGCWCWSSNYEDVMENTKERVNLGVDNARIKAEEMKHNAAEAMQDAKEKGESWTGWAYDKFSE